MSPPEPAAATEWIARALERHEGPLLRYVTSLTGDAEQARDVVQDTFLRLCRQPPGTVEGHLAQWLFTVARHRTLDLLRQGNRMTPLTELDLTTREAPAPSPASAAETQDALRTMLALLRGLPRDQQEVVRLKFQGQLSYQEIAAVTALPEGTVGYLLHTALKTLRQRMARLETRPDDTVRPASA
ncbi:MAG: RNA polymerase sigma factor [Verrucomicrobiota bacterium]